MSTLIPLRNALERESYAVQSIGDALRQLPAFDPDIRDASEDLHDCPDLAPLELAARQVHD